MAKRPSDLSSDDEVESGNVTPPKRARTADSDEEQEEAPRVKTQRGKTKGKGKNKARRNDDESDEDEGEVELDGDKVNDEQFEEEYRQKIMADLEEKRKVHGGIAEHGIIESIEMHSFMCHKYLTFEFGPQINFIIGHNGSGKSAVLSAITVALGGKSNSTGRGNGLKSFIKEGCSVAEVTITLKNQGEEAYKPKEYGKSIIITRRFTKEGSSTWKIMNRHKKVISNKKDELSAICDHMNIQVDNPMNVLTQDAARQFLSASVPADKYKFFLRGTQLSQLSDEYDTCLDNIKSTFKVLAQKKEALPDLRAVFRDATVRYEEAAKAREQKQKADELKKELAWAHVRGKEEEMTAKIQEAAKAAKRLPRIQASVNEATAAVDAATEELTQHEAELEALGDIEDLNQQKETIQAQIRSNKSTLSDFMADTKRMEQSVNSTTKQIIDLEAQIQAENIRMEAHSQAKHEETQRKLEEARTVLHNAEAELESTQGQMRDQQNKCDALKQEGMNAEQELKRIQGEILNCQGLIERSKETQKESLAPYGKNIRQVLERIKNTRWHGDAPLGPLGMHVKAKDPATWGELLRNQLSSYLTAFAVTDAKDRSSLKQILDQTGNHHTMIIIYEKDLFDYSRGEPPESYLTVLRALEISDPYVLRIMINQARIERQVLALTRKEGENILRSMRGGSAWTKDQFRVQVFPEGGSSSTPLNFRSGDGGTNLLLTGRDAASEIRHHQADLKVHEQAYAIKKQEVDHLKSQFAAGRRNQDNLKTQLSRASDACRRAKTALTNLQQELNDEMPTGVASYQAAKEEAEEEKENLLAQFRDVMRQKKEVDDKQKVLLTQLGELKARIDDFTGRRGAISTKAEDAAEKRLKAQRSKAHYEEKLANETGQVKQLEAVADILQEEFTNWTAKAAEYCERVPNPRKAEDVKRHLDSVQHALQEREKRHGATVEEMTIEVNKARAKLENAERDLKQMSVLNKTLKASLVVRLQRWQEFRRHIALRCKLVFGYHLSHRGYYGKVLFNHEHGTLVLKVQTDDQVGTQSKEKDPRSLSGGEKSFSTICLLLSLWESIGCPLRCLDEFDVFMDAVNRRISMKMMIDTANSSDKKQYILITPQDMGNVQLGKTVKVNRMPDPQRATQSH
ncbi:Structural maintenance of chromosomes protein 6 [Hypsizygus marmoreus]|uniref:Structural maintenance of chromosomes protein 6 n=1 Tax=Hypsizygus marmoreus TaxID=39966 RepID=A0A369J3I9_HYPMA|nr:Structural maintenance of chromosomes protein 6 [Hypsizygus marmoreus]